MLDKKKQIIDEIINEISQIDYSNLFFPIYVLACHAIVSKSSKIYKFYRDFKPKKISYINKPLEVQSKLWIDKKNILKKKYGESILSFFEILREKLPNVDLTYFYQNIKSLKMISKDQKNILQYIFAIDFGGLYNIRYNVIELYEQTYLMTIDHELLHMCSSIYDKKRKISFAGFSQSSIKGSIGDGINEGYTQLLTERYFFDLASTYNIEVHIARCLEWIIGKQMENMYFKADLYGLVKELKKYDNEKNIMKFITNVDFISKHIRDKNFYLFEDWMLKNNINEIFCFLLNCYSKKIQQDIKEGFINENVARTTLYSFIELIGPGLFVKSDKKNYYYRFLREEDLHNIIDVELSNIIYNKNSGIRIRK